MRRDGEKTIRIPVRVYQDHIEYFYGQRLPEIRDGVIGDLILDRDALKNPKDLKLLNEKRRVPFLSKETIILVLLKPDLKFPERTKSLIERGDNMPLTSGWTHGAKVALQEPLYLEFRGTKLARLTPVKCQVAALNREAQSLNHAYTMLSAFFERQRRSHTGNIFQLAIFYDQGRGCWRTLNELRDQLTPLYEQRLVLGPAKATPSGDHE